ncbi:MAG: hypothetical protein LBL94_00915 [Prevotellaceae bacterium]|jgi:hypothetical protein|nr:hypothetical protein [Prevotellaceae bacterium]
MVASAIDEGRLVASNEFLPIIAEKERALAHERAEKERVLAEVEAMAAELAALKSKKS